MSEAEYEKAQRELAYLWLCGVITFAEWDIRVTCLSIDYQFGLLDSLDSED